MDVCNAKRVLRRQGCSACLRVDAMSGQNLLVCFKATISMSVHMATDEQPYTLEPASFHRSML